MYYKWLFKLKDGGTIEAKYTNEEARSLELKYPDIKWDWGNV